MKLSNLRLEHNVPFEYGKNQARIICDMQAGFTDKKELWFSVDEEYADLLTDDVYDAFMVALLYPAMYYHEDIEIEGNVSKRLWHNITSYVESCVLDFEPKCKKISIKPRCFSDAEKSKYLHVGTGFSGGVDSFSTVTDNFFNNEDNDYKIDILFFFHVGQYGNVNKKETWERAENRFSITKKFANEAKIPWSILMSSNLFDFYLPRWEYDAGLFCRVASILVFQKVLKRYYVSNDYSYGELRRMNFALGGECIAEYAEAWLLPLFSTSTLDILSDGIQFKRSDKIQRIKDNPFVQKYLNVCVDTSEEHTGATNCSCCRKCLETQFALDCAGVLSNFSNVFDVKKYKKNIFKYECHIVKHYGKNTFDTDNVNFARAKGKKLPSNLTANIACTVYRVAHIFKVAFTNPKKVFHRLFSKGFDV